MRSLDFGKAAQVITDFTLGIKPGENVLLVRDSKCGEYPGVEALLEAIAHAAHRLEAELQIINFISRPLAGMEPPRVVAEAMRAADAVIMMTTLSILQTVATTEALKSGTRVLMLPPARYIQNAPDLLDRLMPSDLKEEQERIALAERIATAFRKGRRIKVTSPNGTDIIMGIGQLKVLHNPTTVREPGEMTIVPGGQILAGVTEGDAEGRFVVDGSASPMYRPLRTPIEFTVKAGRVVDISGAEDAREYGALLSGLNDPHVYQVAEVGVGIHPRAQLTGTPLEDERILGSAWIAVGTNVHLGGTVKAAIHSDCVMLPPIDLAVDGDVILHDRRFPV
jgi:leucyl aminopeptidase (aminopeptidase T)